MRPALRVLSAGLSSTFQDAGRYSYVAFGVAPSGPCDTLLHAIANRLVGNSNDSTTVEFTLKGDSYEMTDGSCRVAVAGDFNVEVDGQKAASWRSYRLEAGQTISIGHATRGVRGYLAVEGGFALSSVLGSHSVHTRTGIGPHHGRAVATGDLLRLVRGHAEKRLEVQFNHQTLPTPSDTLRVVWGPQDDYFTSEAREAFTSSILTITRKCDRMGYQLSGPAIQTRTDLPLISEGVALGSIQVPGNGLFIANLVDRQTVGGYAKIATIVGPDIRALAQMRPGETIRFEPINIAEAETIGRDRRAMIDNLGRSIKFAGIRIPDTEELLSSNLISGVYFDG